MHPSPTTSFQILVVEDEEAIRKLLKQILEGLDCTVLEAFKAKDALTHLEKGGIDLMLLDIRMPGASGLDLLSVMRRQRLSVPTVVVSGFVSVMMAKQLSELGVQGIVAKPFTKDRITGEVQKVLQLNP